MRTSKVKNNRNKAGGARNRPLSAVKREGIVATAGRLFTENGYHAVSMDMIAASVPVSKPTLYNHFSNKETLYKAVMEERCNVLAGMFDSVIKENAGIKQTLTKMGRFFLDRILLPDSIAMYRVMIGESGNFPELGKIFYEAGPARLRAVIMDYLTAQHKAGVIKVSDPELSAYVFINMIKGDAQMRLLLGIPKIPGPAVREKIVDHAVTLFLKGHDYRVKG